MVPFKCNGCISGAVSCLGRRNQLDKVQGRSNFTHFNENTTCCVYASFSPCPLSVMGFLQICQNNSILSFFQLHVKFPEWWLWEINKIS